MLGNERDSLQSHLRACREMVHTAQQHPSNQHYSAIYGVLFEAYAYFSIQTIFRYSASELDVQANLQSLDFYRSLTTYSTFGYLMQASYDLYALIPQVSLFSLRMQGMREVCTNQDLEATYRHLEAQILSQKHYDVTGAVEASNKVAKIYQNGLLIILHASYFCHPSEQSTFMTILKPILSEAMSLFESIEKSFASAPAFWPMVIVGSCLSDQRDRSRLLEYLEYGSQSTGIQSRAREALQWVWSRQGHSLIGPAGLERFSIERKTGLCIG